MNKKHLSFLQAIASFSAGVVSLYVIVMLFHLFPNLKLFFSGISYGPWLEEGFKFIAVLLMIRFIYLTPIMIPFVGLGFGLTERVYHLMNDGVANILPFWIHIILGFIMMYFFYLVSNKKYSYLRGAWYALALLIPVYLHLLYNIGIYSLAKL